MSFKDGRLMWVGKFREGRPVGNCWSAVQGDSWLYGTLDRSGHLSGRSCAFLYPDLSTALVGDFRLGKMVEARPGRVSGCLEGADGILQLEFKLSDCDEVMGARDQNDNKWCSQPG